MSSLQNIDVGYYSYFFILSFICKNREFYIFQVYLSSLISKVHGKIKFHFKRIEAVISCDTPYIERHVRFTGVPFQLGLIKNE